MEQLQIELKFVVSSVLSCFKGLNKTCFALVYSMFILESWSPYEDPQMFQDEENLPFEIVMVDNACPSLPYEKFYPICI